MRCGSPTRGFWRARYFGLYNSIWHWYRPDGTIPLEVVAAFYRAKLLGVIGAEPPLSEGLRAA